MERAGKPENLKRKPKTPGRADQIWGIIWAAVMAFALLIIPHRFTFSVGGVCYTIFDTESLSALRHIVVLFCGAGLIQAAYALAEGRYTYRLLMVSVAADIATIFLGYALFLHSPILSTGLAEGLGEISGWLGTFGAYLPQIIFFGIALGSTVDIFTAVFRTLRHGAAEAADEEAL